VILLDKLSSPAVLLFPWGVLEYTSIKMQQKRQTQKSGYVVLAQKCHFLVFVVL
jgi:hypothetical protein